MPLSYFQAIQRGDAFLIIGEMEILVTDKLKHIKLNSFCHSKIIEHTQKMGDSTGCEKLNMCPTHLLHSRTALVYI